jgi:hypothetical protein
MNRSLNASTDSEIVSASIVPQTTSRSVTWSQIGRIRRQSSTLYRLVVIKFIFMFSECNYGGPQARLRPIIDEVCLPRPPPVDIISVEIILESSVIRKL